MLGGPSNYLQVGTAEGRDPSGPDGSSSVGYIGVDPHQPQVHQQQQQKQQQNPFSGFPKSNNRDLNSSSFKLPHEYETETHYSIYPDECSPSIPSSNFSTTMQRGTHLG